MLAAREDAQGRSRQMASSWSSGTLDVAGRRYTVSRLAAIEEAGLGRLSRLPRSIRVLLENLLRHEDGRTVTRDDIGALASWSDRGDNDREIAFRPARVLLQDFTGVPAVVDLAALRDAMAALGGDPNRINPLRPADLVVDHSVQVDHFGTANALKLNRELEFQRNQERYELLRWGQDAFRDFRVVPPGAGIVHQVNLEYLAPVVFDETRDGVRAAFPDTVVGTDSHTTMINGLGVVGWGVGGIEAEACLLGQPISMLIPDVVGFKLHGQLPPGATATDLVLRVTQMLRVHGVVDKFVEFFGEGLAALPLADRATVANMAPEYGATIGFFPIDAQTLEYLRLSGREESHVALVEAYARMQGLFVKPGDPDPEFTSLLELDLADVEPSLAGPRRPQDRVSLRDTVKTFERALPELLRVDEVDKAEREKRVPVQLGNDRFELGHGSVVIAAITSCTNTSNPSVMMAAGLLAKKAVERGLTVRPWVKTSLAPGSQVVHDYLAESGVLTYLEQLRFNVVGYGCTTCIGNSGPLAEPVEQAITKNKLAVVSVLSGNRNFEGRIHAAVRGNYLGSPPLVVAYALAGRMDLDLNGEPLGTGKDGRPVYLRDIWPSPEEVQRAVQGSVKAAMFRKRYAQIFEGAEEWRGIQVATGGRFAWDANSTYVRRPSFLENLSREPAPPADIRGARVLAVLGDSVTTDHISPAGSIQKDGPAGRYLIEHGVQPADFNSYGARRGNHEVMARGTFANVRLRNKLAPGTEGGVTMLLPEKRVTSIFEAAEAYRQRSVPLIIVAGREYGTGSSRDWAAKGPLLLGVRAVIAESFERIHRSNLIGMGILPLEFLPRENAESLRITGHERFDIVGIDRVEPGGQLELRIVDEAGASRPMHARVRIDTPDELAYYRNGGILPYVLRQLLAS
jgi:aconitate hydratase